MNITGDGFLGLVGSMLGIVGAYCIANVQLKREIKESLEAEKREKKSLLVPGISNIKAKKFEPGYDLGPSGKYFHELQHFSDTTIPIINGGSTPVFDVIYTFEIDNMEKLVELFSEENLLKDSDFKAFFTREDQFLIENDKTITSESDKFIYEYTYQKEGKTQAHKEHEFINRYYKKEPLIRPGEIVDLNLPKFVVMILSYYFIMENLLCINESSDEVEPKIKVIVKYKDYELEEHCFDYKLAIEGYSNFKNQFEFNLAPIEFDINYNKT